jgi:pimeloyl-ACP methyl ester carboxylesterase
MPSSQTHTLPRPVKGIGKDTRVSWSKAPANKAIVFIHGFNGRSLKTWSNFPHYINQHKEFKEFDVYYYGYDSLFKQANNSAISFYEFLHNLYTNPVQLVPAGVRGSRGTLIEYYSVVIVSHSLGTVITRLAMLHANRIGREWVKRTKMILFAPAHNGARVISLLTELLFPPILKFLGLIARYSIVTLDDLDSETSVTIRRLAKDTETLLKERNGDFTKAVGVVWAEGERVVINGQFMEDAAPYQFGRTTHQSVCSPRDGFVLPVESVVQHL